MYFLDAFNEPLDSLITPLTVEAASVDNEGKTIGFQESSLVYELDQEQINRIINAKNLILKANFTIPENAGFAKIHSDNALNFRVFGEFNIKVNADL